MQPWGLDARFVNAGVLSCLQEKRGSKKLQSLIQAKREEFLALREKKNWSK